MCDAITSKPYRSCYFLESGIGFFSHEIGCCCDRPTPVKVHPTADVGKTIDAFLAEREHVIRENQGPNPPCEGCDLFRNCSPDNGQIKWMDFGVICYCNFSCTYCTLQRDFIQDRNKPESYDSLELAKELKRRNLLSEDLEICFSAGEITVHPRKDEYYDFIEQNAKFAYFDSNAGRFDPRLAHILSLSPQNSLMVSLDAGTKETFRKIRGVDALERVVENVAKYHKYCPNLFLKYILLDDNCGDDDLNGFIKICSALKPAQMVITGDLKKAWLLSADGSPLPYAENIVSAAVKLAKGAIQSGINFRFEDILGPSNKQEVCRRLAELPEIVFAERQLDEILSAPRVVCYGAGGNCKIILNQMAAIGLRMPDIIWDRNAQPRQTLRIGADVYPVCRPDFDLLSGGGYGIFSTIKNPKTNQQLDRELKEHGFTALMPHDRLHLALLAKQAKKPI